ncbi:DUF4238 domain-containing protein [Variovorax guangxiensis]|uniref:DUF4238 domain-containing protein n=1 Tax=Variovorax guangxiensis TaxID=1775474 RepID=A0A840FUH2_9BURK|nr:DUF4238 domain-containing protein [Variovorax guangxiensis]MBB4223954.1 hypothetical protein [Variovorax guangxiensis]
MDELTKNQHFVPRLLLRHFTTGGAEEVQIFDSTRNRVRSSSIRRVLSRNYFYDDDNTVEDFLAEKIESPAATAINAIVADPSRAIEPGLPALLTFVAVQMARTPGTQSQALGLIDGFSSVFFEQLAELNGHPTEWMRNLKWRPTDERAMRNQLLMRSTLNRWLLEDLSWHVLSNGTELPFVISDHPAVHYNWYLRDCDDLSYTGITKRGVQIFLPLSPSITLALIDKSVYKFGEKGSSHTVLSDKRDIELLNSLQFRSRQDFVVFPSAMDVGYVQRSCAEIPASSLMIARAGKTDPVSIGGGKLSSSVYVWRTQARYEQWLSMCKIKRQVSKRSVECRDRRPETVVAQMAAARNLFGASAS